jgi:ATP-dependent exoDNAse (exonuclease V) beta subunit
MNDSPQLIVYKASAGSGKTWRLTVEYLKLLILNPASYHSILAVTFTNKATEEMKERVLNALYEIVGTDLTQKPTGMLETICAELKTTPGNAKDKATKAMNFLLHDYGHFRIETIDSFFQSILRNLARELGLGAYLNIELNNTAVLSDAVDAMIDKADKNPEMLKWITDFIEELVQDGKSWKIDKVLKEFGQTIFKEYFKDKELDLDKKLNDKRFLNKFRKQLYELETFSLKQIEEAADGFFKTIQDHNLEVEDFSYGKNGVCSFFLKLKQGICDKKTFEGKRVQACLDNPDSWSTAKSPYRKEISALASGKLIQMLQDTEQIRAKNYPAIISSQLVSMHLNKVGLLTDISREVRDLNLENNRFLLSDTNALLKSLIGESDASFVYEKTGSELNHILFDEFQDTSRMQWDTFRPLLSEGLANGYKSFIVGDEKQSIYRWRNGDWRILGNIKTEMYPVKVREEVLENNWRSEKNIVTFNNTLFKLIERRINRKHLEEFGIENADLENAYKDVVQQSAKKETKGFVEIAFPFAKDKTEYHQIVLERLVKEVEDLQIKGVKPNQIAILIRKNKYIPEIGAYFANHKKTKGPDSSICFDIISDEAFLLSSSKSILILIDALRLLNDPSDPLLRSLLKIDYQQDVLHNKEEMNNIIGPNSQDDKTFLPDKFIAEFEFLQRMPLYELVEELYQIFQLEKIPSQDNYLFTFMDRLSEYLMKSPSDISSFLTYWDDKMSQTSIPASSGVNGIRILSIHKAKGLEFHTVLVPFCDWKLLNERPMQVWCKPNFPPFNQLDLLPVDYKKEMDESCFQSEYREETLQLWVDSLNLLYVAFTRAKQNLIVFCQGKNPKKEKETMTTVSDLILDLLQNSSTDRNQTPDFFKHRYKPAAPIDNKKCQDSTMDGQDPNEVFSEASFLFGELSLEPTRQEDKKQNTSLSQKGLDIDLPFKSFAHKTSFNQSNQSVAFSKGIDSKDFHSSYIDRGKLLHKLFSEIHSKKDIPDAIQDLVNEGLMTTAQAITYSDFTKKALKNPEVSDWFSDKYKLFNECSILYPDKNGLLQLKRPDRVMLSPDGVKVVDFKFGKPFSKYRKQVQEYMQLLVAMGYSKVQGFIWYVDEEKIEEIAAATSPISDVS